MPSPVGPSDPGPTGCYTPASPGATFVPCGGGGPFVIYSQAQLASMPNPCTSMMSPFGPSAPFDFKTQMIVGEPLQICMDVTITYTKICYYSDHIDLTRQTVVPGPVVAHCNVAGSYALAYAVPRSTLPIHYIQVVIQP
ncbi:MAG TPA: hypothetical protein VK842_05470 [bacterium]|nr:hypothetical protein [bacterium]